MMGDSEFLILDNPGSDPPAYCDAWLKEGICLNEKLQGRCERMHAYPPSWTDEDVLEHRRRIEELIAHGTDSDSDSESEVGGETDASVRVLQKYVHEDSDHEADVQEMGAGEQWMAVGTKRVHASEAHARKRCHSVRMHSAVEAPEVELQKPQDGEKGGVDGPTQRIVFEFSDGETLVNLNFAVADSRIPFLQDPSTVVIDVPEIRVELESPSTSRSLAATQVASDVGAFTRVDLLRMLSQLLAEQGFNDDFRIAAVWYNASERLCTVECAT